MIWSTIISNLLKFTGVLPTENESKHIDNTTLVNERVVKAKKTRLQMRLRFTTTMVIAILVFLAYVLQFGHGAMLIQIIKAIN